MSIEKLRLIPQTKFDNRIKEQVIIQYLDTEYIEKTLNNLMRSLENLKDKINEIEDKLKRHINTFEDLAHKV